VVICDDVFYNEWLWDISFTMPLGGSKYDLYID